MKKKCYGIVTGLEQLIHIDKYREAQIRRIRVEVIPDGYMGANVH